MRRKLPFKLRHVWSHKQNADQKWEGVKSIFSLNHIVPEQPLSKDGVKRSEGRTPALTIFLVAVFFVPCWITCIATTSQCLSNVPGNQVRLRLRLRLRWEGRSLCADLVERGAARCGPQAVFTSNPSDQSSSILTSKLAGGRSIHIPGPSSYGGVCSLGSAAAAADWLCTHRT